MIKKMVLGKEISVKVINEIGVLAKITSFLVNHGVNIEAISGTARPVGEEAYLMFVTDNNYEAMNALREHDFNDIQENDVLIIELDNRPGTLKNISELLAQSGINITYLYATTCSSGCPTKIVLSTSDNNLAARILKG